MPVSVRHNAFRNATAGANLLDSKKAQLFTTNAKFEKNVEQT